ncbi:cytoplasmic dynein 2 intermediate chain 1-like isoform X4 [Dreissena polymorpha]|uniref:cytoplasmic dynein 2 intermediate chain 1-like isoform X4 n=1 Tax=Dreissena polymorpha TaxID=45954 RepID=UPI0022652E21|nr:cytoplasmic dynein 2 intermediate chain 1-like isoform X4 [Dreissena polymorpha]
MPSQKGRSKEDTWSTDELNRALNKTGERHHTRDRVKGEDKQRRHREEDADKQHRRKKEEDGEVALTEEERERQREERRLRREGKDTATTSNTSRDRKQGKEIKFTSRSESKPVDIEEEEEVDTDKHRNGDRDKRYKDGERRHRDSNYDEDSSRRHKDNKDDRRQKDDKDDRRHKDVRDDRRRRNKDEEADERQSKSKQRDEEETERRREERRREREAQEREERRKKPEDKGKSGSKDHIEDRDRRKDRDGKTEDRDRHKDRDGKTDDRDRRKDRDSKTEDRDRHKDRDGKTEDRDRHKNRDGKTEERDRHKDRRDKDGRRGETEEEKEERRQREREERRREKERERGEKHRGQPEQTQRGQSLKSSLSKSKKTANGQEKPEEEDDYNYEEDFEDYEEDFEEEDDDNDNDKPSGSTGKAGRNIQLAKPRVINTEIAHDGKGTLHKHSRDGTRLDYSDSEVNDVLRALDAENERLLNSSSRSPQVSANYGRGVARESTNDSDEGGYEPAYQARSDRPRTAINFVSAKQRAINRGTASKTMQRSHDLLKMIELDYTYCEILDLPPVNEYDLYIRSFGSTNTRQAYIQTNEDAVERDVQTEEVDSRSKWTQQPAEDFNGCGRGDGEKDVEEEEESQYRHKDQDLGRLNKFLERAGQVIAILLEEEKDQESGSSAAGRGRQTHITVSEGYTQIDLLPILQGRYVVHSHFSHVQPNLLVMAYSHAQEVVVDNPVTRRGVLCVWNTNEPTYPQKILVCSSDPRCCCFSPIKPFLVFAGLHDGSVAVWDLREPSSIHSSLDINGGSYSLRYPTYDTALVLSEENHHSPVTCIQPIYSFTRSSQTSDSPNQTQASEESSAGMSFQLVSTEESSVLHFWVVAETGAGELSGAENDLGLLPGASVKLIKSSSINLHSPSRDGRPQMSLRSLDMQVMPSDPNHFYVSTDSGFVLHGMRFGKRVFPRAHSPVIEAVVDIVSIDFSPFGQPCFLTGSSDGTFAMYRTQSATPLISWPSITKGRAVQCVRWSRSRPCVFYVLDVASTLYVFDLLEGDIAPKHVESLSTERVTSFELTTDQRPEGSSKYPQILFSTLGGKTELHTVTKSLRDPEQLETDYLASYLDRF